MNVKRFTARTSREALNRVRLAFGKDAVVLSTRPCEEGVEVLAMAPESVQQIERVATPADSPAAPSGKGKSETSGARAARKTESPASRSAQEASLEAERRWDASQEVREDAERLAMSTLSFQDYVRERMLRRRKAELSGQASRLAPAAEPGQPMPALPVDDPIIVPSQAQRPAARPDMASRAAMADTGRASSAAPSQAAALPEPELAEPWSDTEPGGDAPATVARRDDLSAMPRSAAPHTTAPAASPLQRREQADMLSELRAMKGLIEERFSALAFMEKLQRQPRQAQLSQRLLDAGFSPALIRKLVDSLPSDVEENAWASGVLARNLATGEAEPSLEDAGGVYALVGSTGVGKTTSTAKLAAAFATRHGSSNLGLITLDAYRVGAQEQLRAYGRILGVPVHTAHDRASLEDLLDLLSGKRMVLIDTAGMPQRDSRTAELLEMVSHRAVQKLLVVNAAAQGETIEDVLVAYRGAQCRGVVLSKVDEAVKIGPALDALIRHRLKVVAVANGQRVPEDWHRLSSATLVQRALRGQAAPAWRMDPTEIHLVFAGMPTSGHAAAMA